MSNEFYNHGGYPGQGSPGASSSARAEFQAITAGFNKLPPLAGNANRLVVVNPAGDGLASTLTPSVTSLAIAAGTAAAPALRVTGDTNTGIFSPGADSLAISTGGTARLTVANAAVTSSVPVLLPDGTAASPAFTFASDPDNGLYRIGVNDIGLATNGTLRLSINTTALTSTLPALLPGGSAAAPALAFSADTDTGFYRSTADTIGLSAGGALRLSISTSAITATGGAVFTGSGSGLTALNADNLSSGTVPNARLSGAYTNISSLTLSANLTVANLALISIPADHWNPGGSFYSVGNSGGRLGQLDTQGSFFVSLTANGYRNNSSLWTSYGVGTGAAQISLTPSGLINFGAESVKATGSSFSVTTRVQVSEQGLAAINGTAAAPSYTFISDPNTGIYSVGADVIGFATGGTERMRISSAGDVGIGSSNPIARLQILKESGELLRLTSSASNGYASFTSPVGFTSSLILAGDGTTPFSSSFDLQSGASSASINQRRALPLIFSTNNIERMRLDSAGNLGVGTVSPLSLVHARSSSPAMILDESDAAGDEKLWRWFVNGNVMHFAATNDAYTTSQSAWNVTRGTGVAIAKHQWFTGGALRLLLDSSNLLYGTGLPFAFGFSGQVPNVQIHGTTGTRLGIARFTNDTNPAIMHLLKSRGASVGTRGAVQSNDALGVITFDGDDGTNSITAAQISASVDNVPGTNDMPGRLVFSTTPNGASAPLERFRISETGQLLGNAGSAAAPAYSFLLDSNTGLYSAGENLLAITAGGAEAALVSSKGVFSRGPVISVRTPLAQFLVNSTITAEQLRSSYVIFLASGITLTFPTIAQMESLFSAQEKVDNMGWSVLIRVQSASASFSFPAGWTTDATATGGVAGVLFRVHRVSAAEWSLRFGAS